MPAIMRDVNLVESEEYFTPLSRLVTFLIIVLAMSGLLSYLPGLRILGSWGEDYIPMAPTTALSFLILTIIIISLPYIRLDNRKRVLGYFFGLIVSAFGALEVIGFFVDRDLNFEDVLIPSSGTLNSVPIGRMSPSTGLIFFITGIAIVLLVAGTQNVEIHQMKDLPGVLGTLALFLSSIFIFAYVYGNPLLYNQGSTVPMAITTAFGFLLLSLAILASSDKQAIPLRYLKEGDTRTQLLTAFLPLSILAVLVGSFVTVIAPLLSNVNSAYLTAIFIVIVTVLTTIVVNWVSTKVGKSIDEAEAELEKKALELERSNLQLKRSNEELEGFANVASHDLQEPLRTISGYLTTIKEDYYDKIDEEANVFIDTSIRAASRMSDLIVDLLAFSRLGTQKQTIRSNNFILILEEIIENLGNLINEEQVKISFDRLPTLNSDKVQISQLFQNLIGNAIKFSGDTSPVIHIRAKKKKNYWLFSVMDSGIGIEEKDYERIFLSFHRLHSKSEYSGTGIGLAICKKIVEQHNGKIWVESQYGVGSTFYFTISSDLSVGETH